MCGDINICMGVLHRGHKLYGGTAGLCWIDNYSTTHIYINIY